jgi:hypothetical protein
MSSIRPSPIAFIIPEMERHYARHNAIQIVLKTKQSADKDLGIGGTVTENVSDISPEPFINAMNVQAIQQNGGAFRYSDLKMTMARESVAEDIAIDLHTEWSINGDRYITIALTPGASAWEFVIRRKTSEPVTP